MNQNQAIPIAIAQQNPIEAVGIPSNILPQPKPKPQQQQSQPTRTEDDDGTNGGTSIDTFQEYKPTALPVKVVRVCNEWYNNNKSSSSSNLFNTNSNESNDIREGKTHLKQSDKINGNSSSVIDLTEESIQTTSVTAAIVSKESDKDDSVIVIDSYAQTSLSLQVPSHTSSACESALLSSVSAPMVPEETAECLFPLLKPMNQEEQNNTNKDNKTTKNTKRPPPLSPLQLEGVLLSIQRHRRIHYPSNETATIASTISTQKAFRAGFFLGDGAGIGKGRQISAILRDGFCRGRKRHVWISVSRELIKDAQRDLTDVGLHCAKDFVHDGTKFLGDGSGGSGSALGRTEKGVLFLTYNLLVSANRIEQIIAWCAGTEHLRSKTRKTTDKSRTTALSLEETFDGCIVFDEAHKAKNLADNTKTAQLVLMLQRRLPMSRVVYCSATGVSEIDQLAYAERLGLWQIPTTTNGLAARPIYDISSVASHAGGFSDFNAFKRSLEKRGLASLELLALELKTRGSFMARTLSWEGAEFQTAEVPLDKQQRMVYDRCVSWWNKCKLDMAQALEFLSQIPNSGSSNARQVWGTFWAAHQRCFKELAICAKVPFLAKDAMRHIREEGCCVVFGLQGTGEAGMQSLLNNDTEGDKIRKTSKLQLETKRFPTLMSTVSACLTNFVKQHFPVAPFPPDIPSLPKNPPTNPSEVQTWNLIQAEIGRIKKLPPPLPIPALLEQRNMLLEAIRHLELPPNPLDDLIDRLGGVECVAEMTGRSGRIVRENKTDQFVYSKRVVSSDARNASTPVIQRGEDSDRINLIERRLFMDGSKSAAIISDAASTGVSLHAAFGSGASHKRRVHYTIELPWSADKAVQQLGRSHRSGQESAPIYKLVVTNLGGERRFAAAVSKRLASLGALTKGDRRAATGSDMSEFDLDSKYGKRALKRFYHALEENEASGGDSSMGVLGILSSESGKAKAIIEEFVKDSAAVGDTIVKSLPSDDEKLRIACVLSVALAELERVGLDKVSRSKADVRIFLNRLSGLMVTRQSLVFSLFMSTLGGVMNIAKSSGEFEGTAEDLTATFIEIDHETNLGVDPSSGAATKLTSLVLDRGIPFETVRDIAMKEAQPRDENEDGTKFEDFDDGRIAESGFYVSKNRIGGRNLILFAKRKFDPSKFKTDDERVAVDPLGLMQITRPNTGVNLTDKSTSDLRHAYRLILGCEKLRELLSEEHETPKESSKENDDPQYYIKMSKKIASQWKLAFKESDGFNHENGLAPRRQRVSLVNGPVLHILPALEKVVQFRSEKEKALKIMRAQVGARRIVGVRFPSDTDALEKLLAELDTINKARKNAGETFIDEPLVPICPKTMSWATTKRKTMKSFFTVTTATTASTTKGTKMLPTTDAGKKRSFTGRAAFGNAGKKSKPSTKTMTAYFSKKK